MLNCDPPPLSYSPSARNRDRRSPSGPQPPARCFSTMWNGNASCPAGTGVCVVKIVVRRTSSSASSNDLPFVDVLADPLQDDEGRVPFVQMEDRRRRSERAQDADAADAENDFLLDAHLAIAAVEARRELRDPRARSPRGRCRADTASRGRAARATPRPGPIDRRAARRRRTACRRAWLPARSARRPSSASRRTLPATLRRRRAGGSSPAGT